MLNIKPVLRGLSSYVPGLNRAPVVINVNARYCYSVWLRHLIMASGNGLKHIPENIAELGPGEILGVGLAALLSGSRKYYAFDVVKYFDSAKNLETLEELLELFKRRESIPDNEEWPLLKPRLKSYDFPEYILNDTHLDTCLSADRVESIRQALLNLNSGKGEIQIFYIVPWYEPEVIQEETIDMIISQAVMEHISNLPHTYETMYRWLKPGGLTSNQIDYKCHEISKIWNGHWEYPDFLWRLAEGKRTYWINRQPHSTHINLLNNSKFQVIHDIKAKELSGIPRNHLAPKFRNLSEDDFTTSGGYILAKKPNGNLQTGNN